MKESKKLKSKHSFLEMGAYQVFAGGVGGTVMEEKEKNIRGISLCSLLCCRESVHIAETEI